MAIDLNALRKVGFSRRQSQTLTSLIGGATLDAPITSYLTYRDYTTETPPADLHDGSVHLEIDPVAATWTSGPDLDVSGDPITATVLTSALYLFTGRVRLSYHNDAGDEVPINQVVGYNTASVRFIQSDTETAIPFHNATNIHFGWLDMAVTLVVPAGSIIDIIVSSEVKAVSNGALLHTYLDAADIDLTRYIIAA